MIYSEDPCDHDMFDVFSNSVEGTVTCDKVKFSVGLKKKFDSIDGEASVPHKAGTIDQCSIQRYIKLLLIDFRCFSVCYIVSI